MSHSPHHGAQNPDVSLQSIVINALESCCDRQASATYTTSNGDAASLHVHSAGVAKVSFRESHQRATHRLRPYGGLYGIYHSLEALTQALSQ